MSGGETANRAEMAALLSQEVFSVFGWQRVGPLNVNWRCVLKTHSKSAYTHPSDIVYRYLDPYTGKAVYISCDVKSYARDSIAKYSIAAAISSLGKATECMNISDEWQRFYLQPNDAPDARGLLFVYNHDGDYDKDFKEMLSHVDKKNFSLRKGRKFYIMGPSDIVYLKTISSDIERLRGRKILPDSCSCSFYYPDQSGKILTSDTNLPATIEMLIGPWQVLQYKKDNKIGLLLYCKTPGSTVEELLFIIDFIAHYQMLKYVEEVNIRLPNADRNAVSNFSKALFEYSQIQGNSALAARLEKIKAESVTEVYARYSDIEIGMGA